MFLFQVQTEEAEKSVVIVKAKEIDGQAVAEDRSQKFLDDNHPADDQIAVESIDRDQTVYVPPPQNLVQAPPIPVPVSLAAKPGSLVLPGLPQGPPPRRPGFGPPPRRPLPRRPPPPVHKRPYPVITNYAPPPALAKIPNHRLPPPPPRSRATFFPPPPLPSAGFAAPPNAGFAAPPPVGQSGPQPAKRFVPPQQQPSISDNLAPPVSVAAAESSPKVNFGFPKEGDVFRGSESEVSSLYSGPPPPAPAHTPVPAASVQEYVPPSSGESRAPVVNSHDVAVAASGPANSYIPPTAVGPSDPWPITTPDMPQIVALDVKCEKNLMKVRIEFDKPFNGIIFSKGHYSNVHCVHLPAALGRTHSTFDISINSCGTQGNTENGLYGYGSQSGSGTYFENTIVVQYDPQVQEVWDQARKLRCTWHDQYEKSVTFRPFSVDMLDVVRADFAGDNVGCWMQIQVGKGPWASEVSGLVKIGQTMTMVLAIKDDDNKFDMLVRNCMAHDGKRAPIQLVDQRGCITRPKLMSRFTKIKDFGASASVLSYAHFQAFKFPDSMEVHFQCTIQICRYQCPEQCSEGSSIGYQGGGGGSLRDRSKRSLEEDLDNSGIDLEEQADVGVNRIIQVVSTRDLTFVLDKNSKETEELKEVTKETLIDSTFEDQHGLICMSTPGFAATLVVLLGILIVSCLLSAFLCLRFRVTSSPRSILTSYENPAFLRKPDTFDYH